MAKTVPLRFHREDKTTLRRHLDWCLSNGVNRDMIGILESATTSAEQDIPVDVKCDSPQEVEQLADVMASRFGVRRPLVG